MAYDEKLANRIREALIEIRDVVEKTMMGGLIFMVNDKMCVGIMKDEMMCRVDPDLHESLVEKMGCRTMELSERPMRGYVLIDDTGMKTNQEFNYWVNLCLEYNIKAKSSKRKSKKHS